MSICSDVSISKKDAKDKAIRILMARHLELVNIAVSAMSNWELSSVINEGMDTIYYNIEDESESK